MTDHDRSSTPATPVYAAMPQPSSSSTVPPSYAAAAPTNAMAIIALVASILGWIMIPVAGSVVGIILGHQARKQIAVSGESGGGMATAAITLGWIMVALIALSLLALLGFLVFAAAASA
jgi:heme/copper-type cytochrome/quinol oxidase subunit 2